MENKLDLRIQKTYRALHTAFTQLLETKAIEDISVNELCDVAMIRRTTFYKHFSDKYDYFNFYLMELRQSFKSQIPLETVVNDPTSYSITMLREMFIFIHQHQQLVRQIKNSNMMSFLHQTLQEHFSAELRYILTTTYGASSTQELELLISFYAGGLINIVYWWISHPNVFDENTIIEYIVKNIIPNENLFKK